MALCRRNASSVITCRISLIEQPISVGDQQVGIGVSVGIAFGRIDGDSFDDLCRRADIAMYVAKASGRNTYCIHQPSMDSLSSAQARIGLLDARPHDRPHEVVSSAA